MSFYTLMGLLFLTTLFLLNLLFLFLGYKYSKKYKFAQSPQKESGMQIIEGSVLALLGLLLAFTFSSAANKFDQRRALIIEEANAIGTLFLRLDLLPTESQNTTKQLLKTYLDLHIKAYQALPNDALAMQYFTESHQYQTKIWNEATTSCTKKNNNYTCMLIIPALNQAFDLENMRLKLMQLHPPKYIFTMLIFVSLIAVFFIGSHIHNQKEASKAHIVFYSLIISLIIYTIIDMEYPRLGFIRVDSFDKVLLDLKSSFNEVIKR